MRADLDHLPPNRQRDLHNVALTIKGGFDNAMARGKAQWRKDARIEKIILFGSFATGSWVDDLTGNYLSDYDILVVVNHPNIVKDKYWHDVEALLTDRIWGRKPTVNMIVHDLTTLNQMLHDGLYFFADIRKEGILLYDRPGSKELPTPGLLKPADKLRVAKLHYEIWRPKAERFCRGKTFMVEDGDPKLGAFMLHQCIESTCACMLLVLSNYLPKTHDLSDLHSLITNLDPTLVDIWPGETEFQSRSFERIKRAYVEARYADHFEIELDELTWATERAELLMKRVWETCEVRISELEKAVS